MFLDTTMPLWRNRRAYEKVVADIYCAAAIRGWRTGKGWTEEEEDFDAQIFYYYEDYAELNQHLKDGDETYHDFIVTKIINQ